MPNWVINKVTIKTDDQSLLNKIFNEIKGKEYYGTIDFETIIPMPEDIYRGEIGRKERETYKEKNWYDWSIENWGTKWNACECVPQVEGSNTIIFQTAWNAPEPVIQELSKKYNVDLIREWADEDLGNNCGVAIYQNGKRKYFSEEGLKFACDLWEYDYDDILGNWLE